MIRTISPLFSGEVLYALIQSSPIAVIVVDQKGLIGLANRQCQLLFGYSEDELREKPVELLLPERLRGAYSEQRRFFLQQPTARVLGAEHKLFGLRKNGTEVAIAINLNPFNTPSGPIALASITDITERALAEERFRSVVEASPNAKIMADSSGEIVLANRQTEILFGYDRSELIGQKIEILVPTSIRSRHPQLREKFTSQPQTRAMGAGRDLKGRRKDGVEISIEIGLNPIETSEGKFVLATIVDISERRKNEELAASQKAAVEASRMKSLFLANMSHEIRTPMNGILGMTELLLHSALDETQRDYAETIQRSAEAMLMVVNDILDFSQIEAGKLKLHEHPFDLNLLLRDRAKLFGPAAAKKSIALRLSTPTFPNSFVGDPIRLGQVLSNLIGNAIKFTEQGEVEIRVSYGNEAGSLLFEVLDTGKGIAATSLPHLFESFSQADDSPERRFQGTGLGLSISKRLVEMMRGTIGVDSRQNEGFHFWFRLPLPETNKVPSPSATKFLAEPTKPSGFRILVAEDNKVNQKLVAAQLSLLGHSIRIEANGKLALEALANETFDLVLLDCHMPVLDGFETTAQIRRSPVEAIRNIPVIAMTAGAIKGDRELCLDAGMNDYLSKPIQLELLKAMLERWLPPVRVRQ